MVYFAWAECCKIHYQEFYENEPIKGLQYVKDTWGHAILAMINHRYKDQNEKQVEVQTKVSQFIASDIQKPLLVISTAPQSLQ